MPTAVLLNPADPLYDFEHQMSHREYFAVMNHLPVLSYGLDVPPFDSIPAGDYNFRHQQAHRDLNGNLPSNYSNGYSLTTITPPDATATGNSSGSGSLALTGVTNTVLIGATVAGAGVPAGTTIVQQVSGTPGGDGGYITSQATALSNVALTLSHPPYQQANDLKAGQFGRLPEHVLLEGVGPRSENRSWQSFINHQEHYAADQATLPIPATSPTTAGTGPGQENLSNPWWWATVSSTYTGPLW